MTLGAAAATRPPADLEWDSADCFGWRVGRGATRDPRSPDCGRQGRYRDAVTRPLTDLPVAGYPLVLRVAVPRYRCVTGNCGRVVFCQDLGKLAARDRRRPGDALGMCCGG
jgi:zinc-finger of transposase IS204/IS1001/IS1096/IS1165